MCTRGQRDAFAGWHFVEMEAEALVTRSRGMGVEGKPTAAAAENGNLPRRHGPYGFRATVSLSKLQTGTFRIRNRKSLLNPPDCISDYIGSQEDIRKTSVALSRLIKIRVTEGEKPLRGEL